MLKEQVGEYAGKIWEALDIKSPMTRKEIKKAAKLNDKTFFMGLGWLLREDKVETNESEKDIIISLK